MRKRCGASPAPTELDWSVAYPAGTSRIEPGVTPAQDMTLTFARPGRISLETCGQSRLWGGVHFPASAVEASAAYCSVFGDMAYEYYTDTDEWQRRREREAAASAGA